MGIRIDSTADEQAPPLELDLVQNVRTENLDEHQRAVYDKHWVSIHFDSVEDHLTAAGRRSFNAFLSGDLRAGETLLTETVMPEDERKLADYLNSDGISLHVINDAAAEVAKVLAKRPTKRLSS